MNAQRDPLPVLEEIPGFANATVLSQLSDGPSNRSWEVSRDGDRFVLRIDKPETRELGLDREAEKQVCQIIADIALGPEAVFFDAARGIYLRPFLPGRSWTTDDLHQPGKLQRLADLLRQVHRLALPEKHFDPLGAAQRYARSLGTAEAEKMFDVVQRAFDKLRAASPALCHNDLVCHNVLESGSLMLIDWEYAGAGDAFFDLAIIVQHHGLPGPLEQHFLEAYLGRPAQESERRHLAAQKAFYAALLDLWEARLTLPND